MAAPGGEASPQGSDPQLGEPLAGSTAAGEVARAAPALAPHTGAAPAPRRRSFAAKGWLFQQYESTYINAECEEAATVETGQAVHIVKQETTFATFMCVVLACLKLIVYMLSGSRVVKTCAVDSFGDLVANVVSMYTSWKMSRPDTGSYPVGQGKFANIGVLLFSTLMVAALLSNAVDNLEELFADQETSNESAIKAFWSMLFGASWGAEQSHEWRALKDGVLRLVSNKQLSFQHISTLMRKTVNAATFASACSNAESVLHEIAKVETEEEATLANIPLAGPFLTCCAAYKLCLWLHCVLIAIPKTCSSVLRALSNDARNDFLASGVAATCLLAGWLARDNLGEKAEKMDPFLAVLLSFLIMLCWLGLLKEQVVALSQPVADPHTVEQMQRTVQSVVNGKGCRLKNINMSSCNASKYIVHVELGVLDMSVAYDQLDGTINVLSEMLLQHPLVERVVICPRSMSSVGRSSLADGVEQSL